jgi:hypothetical protein
MYTDFLLGKNFRIVLRNNWEYLSTPHIWLSLDDPKGIGFCFFGLDLSLRYYPYGDAHENMFSTEFYEEDYDEELYEDEDHEEDTKLNKNNIALRDEIV